nr:hypothetical protein [Tanacetum cinerariifolium]
MSEGGRDVKEKEGLSANNDELNEALGTNHDTSTPKVVNEVGKDDVSEFFPPLSTTAGNAPGNSSYANITGKPNEKKVNVYTLFTPGGNGIDVVVPVNSIRAISERFVNTAYGSSTGLFSFQLSSLDGLDAMLENGLWFIQNNPLIVKNWHMDKNLLKEDVSTVPVWVKLHGVPVTTFSEDGLSAIATKLADVELKDNIVAVMPKITREAHYTCNVRVEYKRKPPRCSFCKVFGHIHEECTKNTGAGEKKTVKKPSQISRGVPVGPKLGFKPQKEYRSVLKKPNASSSGNKKNGVEATIEVSNLNSFDVLNSVDNDEEFGTKKETNNLVNNEATSCGSYFMNIDNDEEFASNTPIGEKINKIERQIGEGISTSGKDESDKDYDTNSLLEKWKDSYPDNDDYDPYDDDMYENHDLSENLQSICDDLDIMVRGRKRNRVFDVC